MDQDFDDEAVHEAASEYNFRDQILSTTKRELAAASPGFVLKDEIRPANFGGSSISNGLRKTLDAVSTQDDSIVYTTLFDDDDDSAR